MAACAAMADLFGHRPGFRRIGETWLGSDGDLLFNWDLDGGSSRLPTPEQAGACLGSCICNNMASLFRAGRDPRALQISQFVLWDEKSWFAPLGVCVCVFYRQFVTSLGA